MSKFCKVLCLLLLICVVLQQSSAVPHPQPQQHAIAPSDSAVAEDLEAGVAAEGEKEDLQGAASIGYGYYSYPYLGGYYGGGGYYPYYSGYYGLGYPYYGGGYYGGYHGGYHGHYY